MNLSDIKPAVANIKPLLFKWAAAFIVLAIPVSIWSTTNLTRANIVQKTDILGVRSRAYPAQKKKTKMPVRIFQQKRPRAPQVVAKSNIAPINIRPVNSPGNTYPWGQCTWYAKSKRPDLPNRLGNANMWTINARRHGIATGLIPKEGAIGQKGMHVVYVEKVNPDGSMLISDMNYVAPKTFDRRTVASSGYNFIY